MDLNTIGALSRPTRRADLAGWRDGDAWLAGGTWLFSEPQPGLRRLIDLSRLGWPAHEITGQGLTLSATCTIADLIRFEAPAEWAAAPLFGECGRALLGSFKIRTMATVGGNICLALPAAPMIALVAALDGTCLVWMPDGGERRVSILDLVVDAQRTSLAPGEILRSVDLPAAALARRAILRRVSLTPGGRSAALLIGTLDDAGAFALTITASVRRPVRLDFPDLPTKDALAAAVAGAVPPGLWHDDVHGAPDWRRHMTLVLAEEIRHQIRHQIRREARP